MSQTIVNLYNQALSTAGDSNRVSSVTEKTRQAAVCNLWFPQARRSVFAAFHWPSLRAVARLSPSAIKADDMPWSNGDPAPGFKYAFQLPADCVAPRYLSDFSRFTLGRHGGTRSLFTNCNDPILHYTEDVENPGEWEPALYDCVVYALAASLNMAVNGKANLTEKLERQVQQKIILQATDAANQDQDTYEEIPQSWIGTGFSVPAQRNRYIYPVQSYNLGTVGQ